MNPFILIIFGATGHLFADKLAKALYLLYLEGKLPDDFNIIAFARRDFSDESFRTLTKDNILKRGEADFSKIDNFLGNIKYFQGDFFEKDDFVRLGAFLEQNFLKTNAQILLHMATPSSAYERIFANIRDSGFTRAHKQAEIMIEKPFGVDEASARRLEEVLSKSFKEEKIFHVDHYLAKETTLGILDFRWQDGSHEAVWNGQHIKKIKVSYDESNVVGARGASYDTVGAFRDVGQNHMLQLLAISTMEKPNNFDAKHIRESRAKALADLYIDKDQKITKGQYAEYISEVGVAPDSTTETFFRFFLRSRNSIFNDVLFELEGGKGLIDMHSDITTTTVAIEIDFKNAKKIQKRKLEIQPVVGSVYESYTRVYNDALRGDQTNFVSIEEIFIEWKLADELLSIWKDTPLVIYNNGSKAEDIK